eukprot:1136630-Pelagomonas_calceolata.AAC.2
MASPEALTLCNPTSLAGPLLSMSKENKCRQYKHSPRQYRKKGYLGPRHYEFLHQERRKERGQWGPGGPCSTPCLTLFKRDLACQQARLESSNVLFECAPKRIMVAHAKDRMT